jgi:hypothetical protein
MTAALAGCGTSSGAAASALAPASSGTRPTALTGHGRWTALPPGPLPALEVAAGVWTGTELLVVGKPDTLGSRLAVAAAYRPSTRSWRRLADLSVSTESMGSAQPAAVWTGHEMVVAGLGFLAALDPGRGTWRRLEDPGDVAARTDVLAVWTGRQVLVLTELDDGWSYDPASDRWDELPEPPGSSLGAAAVWTGTELVVVGGRGRNGRLAGPAQVYTPGSRAWRTTAALPQGRVSPSAVWDGREVILTGGQTETRTAATQAALDPATGRWRILPGGESPAAGRRWGHRSAWTGAEVLIWGGGRPGPVKRGTSPFVPAPHGVAFDPARGTWTPLPISPLAGRQDAVVAWTGTQLLVWGGRVAVGADGRRFTDGAEYRE